MNVIFSTDEQNIEMLEKLVRGVALYLLSGAAAFSFEVVVYSEKGWLQGTDWWLQSFLPPALWLLAPYLGFSSILLKMKHNLRQLIVLFFGSAGTSAFGIAMMFDGFFIHMDPKNRVIFWVVPIYQWVALAGTAALRHAVGKKPVPSNEE